jgi:hypothetical protein
MRGFKNYESKPIIRLAREITLSDCLHEVSENLYRINDELDFVAYQRVHAGDFIVYLNETDVYHCSSEVFHERNIV